MTVLDVLKTYWTSIYYLNFYIKKWRKFFGRQPETIGGRKVGGIVLQETRLYVYPTIHMHCTPAFVRRDLRGIRQYCNLVSSAIGRTASYIRDRAARSRRGAFVQSHDWLQCIVCLACLTDEIYRVEETKSNRPIGTLKIESTKTATTKTTPNGWYGKSE